MGSELLDQSAGRSGGKERRQPVLGRAGQYLFLGRSVEARRRRYIDAGSAVRGSSRSQPLRQVRERGVQSTVVGLSVQTIAASARRKGGRGIRAICPARVFFDRVQRGLSIGSFRFAPRAD